MSIRTFSATALAAIIAGALGGALISSAAASGKDTTAEKAADNGRAESAAALAEVRRATQRFRDVNVAINEGYVAATPCITAEMEGEPRQLGAMGIHYVHGERLFGPGGVPTITEEGRVSGNGVNTDFTKPSVLVYEPQKDGALELVAVENLVFAEAWRSLANDNPPEFEGNQYYYMIDNPLTENVDEAHGFEPHYELHVWLYRENPAGMFMPFNTRVSCPEQPHQH